MLFLLLLFLLLILLILVAFYNSIRFRQFYTTNVTLGDPITFNATTNNYFNLTTTTNATTQPLAFVPLYTDRRKKIRGEIILLTRSTTEQYVQLRLMNGTTQISEKIEKIRPGLSRQRIGFVVGPNDNRTLQVEARRYNQTTNTVIAGAPVGVNLIEAWSYYY